MKRSLDSWVDYIQTLHHRQIDLSLDRVREVYQRLWPDGVSFTVVTIAGTNGKGSTAELLSSIYHAAGHKVAKYTSPHLMYFNERYLINREMVGDAELLAAFERIENVRAGVPITYFEFATLIAIELFQAAAVDIAIMEVGLGGRQDAVNVLDADVAVVTSVSIDHTAWLGDNVDDISYEKIGVARTNKPCVVGIAEPSKRLIDYCSEIDANCLLIERDFSYQLEPSQKSWNWQSEQSGSSVEHTQLPLPFDQTGVQLSNASIVLQVIELLAGVHSVDQLALRNGLANAHLAARCQVLARQPLIVLDVAHNVSSVQRLVTFLQDNMTESGGKVIAVCGMLSDKEVAASLTELLPVVSEWRLVTIHHERGSSAHELVDTLSALSAGVSTLCYQNVTDAYQDALKTLKIGDTLVVFGSFFIAGDILKYLSTSA